jgi:hypothetical protein
LPDPRDPLSAVRERVVLTTERLQEVADDLVRRGRLTRRDAEDLVSSLVSAGRSQTEALLSDLEQLLGRTGATRVLRTVTGAGAAPGFPIADYDSLTAAQISKLLPGLPPAALRKVADHERSHANPTSVLAAIEKALRS